MVSPRIVEVDQIGLVLLPYSTPASLYPAASQAVVQLVTVMLLPPPSTCTSCARAFVVPSAQHPKEVHPLGPELICGPSGTSLFA